MEERQVGCWGFLVRDEIPDEFRRPGDVGAFMVETPTGETVLSFLTLEQLEVLTAKLMAYVWRLQHQTGPILN